MAFPEGKFAATVKMGIKGQIVIPQEAREMFGFGPGDTLLLLADKERGIVIARSEDFEAFGAMVMRNSGQPPRSTGE